MDCSKAERKCLHPKATLKQKLTGLKKREAIRPFILIVLTLITTEFGGTAIKIYLVQILDAYRTPIDPNDAAV